MTIRLFRYPITLHYSWFILFGLLTWGLSTEFIAQPTQDLSLAAHWALAAYATFLILTSVLLHELAHAFVAEHYQLRVTGISLHLLGGWTTFQKECHSPRLAATVALAGPACSLLLAAFAWPFQADVICRTLYKVNLVLGMYNLFIPCLPLDGGRILHAWLWHRSGSFSTAWEQTAKLSKHISVGMMTLAIIGLALHYDTIWIFFIAIVLRLLADQAHKPVAYSQQFPSHLRDLMVARSRMVSIGENQTLQELKTLFLRHGYGAYPVTNEAGAIMGLVRYRDAQHSPQWMTNAHTPLSSFITPLHPNIFVSPQVPLIQALDQMILEKVDQLLVMEDGVCVGWITRSMITRVQHALRNPRPDGKASTDVTQPIWQG